MNAQLKKPAIHGGVGGAVSFDLARCQSEALAVLESIGVTPGGMLEVSQNGSFTRCPTVGHPRCKNGAYRWYVDGVPNLQAWNHETNQKCEWVAGREILGRELTPAEREQIRQQRDDALKAHEFERESRRQKAIDDTQELVKTASTPASDWPYLARKGIGHHAKRFHLCRDKRDERDSSRLASRDFLFIPLHDLSGQVHGGQRIYAESDNTGTDKKLLAGTDKKGHAAYPFASGLLEPDAKPECILITEGVSTAASVYDLSDGLYPVVCAIDAGNLEPVAVRLRERFPASKIVVCGDVDGNQTGQRAAGAAAEAVGGVVCLPDFLDQQGGGSDWNDLFLLNEGEARRQLIAGIPVYDPAQLPEHFTLLDDYDESDFSKKWIVQDFLEDGRAYQFFGGWKSGKTLVTLDMALHLAHGLPWAGRKTVKSLVIWIASESLEDVRRRAAAWRLYHGNKDACPFVVRERAVHLDEREQASQMARDIAAISGKYPGLPVLLVVDTVARSMSGKTSENAEGLQAFANHLLDLVVRPMGVTAVCVHHSGHGDSSRSRGYSGFPAALDGSIQVWMDKGNPDAGIPSFVNVAVTESRSTAGTDSFQFRLDIQELPGSDNFGRVITEPVLFHTGQAASKTVNSKKLAKNPQIALDALRGLYQQYRDNLADSHSNEDAALVAVEDWRQAFYVALGDSKQDSKKKAFQGARDTLAASGLIRITGVHVQLTQA